MYDFIDGDYFESLADFSFGDMYSPNATNPDYQTLKMFFDKFELPVIFIETHRVGLLFRELSNFRNNKCKIICHNSDATFGEELLRHLPDNVEKMWCQNYNYLETERLKSLPIGLERVRWFPEQRKQELLFNIMSEEIERTELVYMNFNPGTNPIRKQIYDSLKDKDFINKEMIGNGGDYSNYLMNLKKHKFVISPPGNGIDCHRNWEALYCGCIPIVLDSYFVRNVFKDLSVLIISDYSDINLKLLNIKYNKLKNINFNIDIIRNRFYLNEN
jgi:hypothetical protein